MLDAHRTHSDTFRTFQQSLDTNVRHQFIALICHAHTGTDAYVKRRLTYDVCRATLHGDCPLPSVYVWVTSIHAVPNTLTFLLKTYTQGITLEYFSNKKLKSAERLIFWLLWVLFLFSFPPYNPFPYLLLESNPLKVSETDRSFWFGTYFLM